MALAVAGVVESEFTTPTDTFPVVMPACQRGDLLLVVLALVRAETPISNPSAAGWTLVRTGGLIDNGDVPFLYLAVIAKIADGNESTVDFAISQNDVLGVAQAYCVTGWARRISSVAVSGSLGSGVSTAPDPSAVAVSWVNASTLWIAVAVHGNDGAVAAVTGPAGYAGLVSTAQSSGALRAGLATAYREQQAGSEDPPAFGLDSSEAWIAYTIGIESGASQAAGRSRRRLVEINGRLIETDSQYVDYVPPLPEVEPPRPVPRTVQRPLPRSYVNSPIVRPRSELLSTSTGLRRLARK